jgi:hypothetical protein
MRPINSRPTIRDLGNTNTLQRLKAHENILNPIAFLFTVISFGLSWFNRQGDTGFANELLTGFIHTNDRKPGIIRLLVNTEHFFHLANKFRVRFRRDTPFLFQPGFQFIFLSVWRTVSGQTDSTNSNSTNLSANSLKVQRAFPSGAELYPT